ncbi:MAG: hypothetical protein EOO47_09930 [Flavobacterium sp.]|nr:MAG: hypothetical protein EOO47_09930 [Flavobacterium sp.]
MAKQDDSQEVRKHMELAVEVMKKSIQEPRDDKTSPKVGAVLIKTDGTVETAFRGELRHGDHAEFTLLERKNRSTLLDGATLYATLEPCAPNARKHPKLGCAERIVNARIKKVYIGVEDPDPTVDRKGIKYLQDNGIEVEMFDKDLQSIIWEENKQFKLEAEDRAKKAKSEATEVTLTEKENIEPTADLDDFSREALQSFIGVAKLGVEIGSTDFNKVLKKLGFIKEENGYIKPTGIGLLLFGNHPQHVYQNAVIKATYKTEGRGEEIKTISGPLISQPDEVLSWFENHVNSQIDRSHAKREVNYDFPAVVFREAIINAIVHRDYDINGAPIYLEINDDVIIIKSPGEPVAPLKLEQMQTFSAPSLSRNPKLMYVFDQLGIVEQRGLGFKTIKELPEKFDLPLPKVTYEAPYMVFTFPRNIEASRKLSNNRNIDELKEEELIGYQWMQTQEEVSTREYANKFNIGQKTASRQLKKMKQLNFIEDNGFALTSPKYKYKAIKVKYK